MQDVLKFERKFRRQRVNFDELKFGGVLEKCAAVNCNFGTFSVFACRQKNIKEI